MKTDHTLITTSHALNELCEHIAQQSWVTLDTEFLREKTYRPQLCLIQVATEEHVACIDPQTIDDFSAFYEILSNPNIVKVLHAAHQDLEIFYIATQTVPSPIFDTQIAASVLGYGDQLGYARLVEAITHVQLDKSQSRTDWSKRPLSPKQLSYAAADVTYLRDVYKALLNELNEKNRLDWLDEDFTHLSTASTYEPEFSQLWKKVRQHQRLKPEQLNRLKHLCIWREERAIASNRPRKWIVSDDTLLDIIRINPQNAQELGELRGIQQGFVSKHGDTVLSIIRQAEQSPKESWPTLPKKISLNAQQDNMLDYLMLAGKIKSQEHDIALGRLTSSKELQQLIVGERNLPVLRGWKKSLLGNTLLSLINHESQLVWRENELIIDSTQ